MRDRRRYDDGDDNSEYSEFYDSDLPSDDDELRKPKQKRPVVNVTISPFSCPHARPCRNLPRHRCGTSTP